MITTEAVFIDSEHLKLLHAYPKSKGKKVRIFIWDADEEKDHKDWHDHSIKLLNRAYCDQDPEYGAEMVKEPNPEYRS
ncbi:MAG: hypothetical protein JJU29_21280 [Verrucomicrobia bacterium]|nr:hypothetical protein [Verrucomicrobiota bacterium]MCH8510813.1 hypothetical protein [Kiritimatiellia bacterium]